MINADSINPPLSRKPRIIFGKEFIVLLGTEKKRRLHGGASCPKDRDASVPKQGWWWRVVDRCREADLIESRKGFAEEGLVVETDALCNLPTVQ